MLHRLDSSLLLEFILDDSVDSWLNWYVQTKAWRRKGVLGIWVKDKAPRYYLNLGHQGARASYELF